MAIGGASGRRTRRQTAALLQEEVGGQFRGRDRQRLVEAATILDPIPHDGDSSGDRAALRRAARLLDQE
ncbi:MAG: hypothetical protein KBB39_06820 [Phycicoccus sp.]|nr:hypothetical protein [Phycicoccus sp.]